jgi:hypothetical protein
MPKSQFETIGYFDAYIRYWEQYHINLATTGLLADRPRCIVPFGRERMERIARTFHDRFNSTKPVAEFVSTGSLLPRHPEWLARSEEALTRVEAVWRLVDLPFPAAELRECL